MKNIDVIKAFVNGAGKGKNKRLSIKGNKLFDYNTIICEKTNKGYNLNKTKYSKSTSAVQSMLSKEIDSNNINGKVTLFDNVEINSSDLK
jgi:hypothetical protein